MKNTKDKINTLVDELDKLFSDGVGHVNIDFKNNAEKIYSVQHYNECTEGKGACGIPTEDIDNEE